MKDDSEKDVPSVSVIMPMRNAERFVAESVRSILSQSLNDLELVVIDDGSTDRSAAIIEEMADARVRVLAGPCSGIAGALNTGLKAARGRCVARCDADDLFPADRLAWQVKWMDEHPDYGAVCGSFSTMDWNGRHVRDLECGAESGDITDELASGETRTHLGTFAIRREVLEELGGFRPFFEVSEDIDLQMRLPGRCRVWYEPRCSYVYRLHESSIMHSRQAIVREWYETMARQFAHQRASVGQDDLELGRSPKAPMGAASTALSARQQVQDMLVGKSWDERFRGRYFKSIGTGLRACMVRPSRLGAWRSLAALVLKPGKASERTESTGSAGKA